MKNLKSISLILLVASTVYAAPLVIRDREPERKKDSVNAVLSVSNSVQQAAYTNLHGQAQAALNANPNSIPALRAIVQQLQDQVAILNEQIKLLNQKQ